MQVVMNKCFFLNLEKTFRVDPSGRLQETANSDALQFRKNDVTELRG